MARSFFCCFLLLRLLTSPALKAATPTISDSIDITHITIKMDITDYVTHVVKGNATLFIKAKADAIGQVPLDLLELTVDSISGDGGALTFNQSGELLTVSLLSELNTNDSTQFTVYYHGIPAQDGSWGGWYWSGDYSYQLGVGFDAIPHNYGRVWFPCFDNFIERSTFRYEITTTADKKAFCGGLLESSDTTADGRITWIWNCNQTIPSYLASVAVSTYTSVEMTYDGIEREIPIEIAVKPEDSLDAVGSFEHLNSALQIFENHYGPFEWDRVGYAVVPFSGGAMEHAMNIAYPLFSITGTTVWESLFVHELSHHWWGDLITTSKAEEMWMNEGWASYSEHLFTEFQYGEQAYKDAIAANHSDILQYCAAQDGNNYFAISDVPQTFTYGYTTYKKGADVVHTMRGYLGDSLFFSGITSFLQTHQFQAVSAADLRDHLTSVTGKDMTDFFNDWVYQPGAPAFEIDDIGTTEGDVSSICIEQKLDHATHLANHVPLQVQFFDSNLHQIAEMQIEMSGDKMMFGGLDIPAEYVIIDHDQKIDDAVTEDELHISAAAHYQLNNALVDLDIHSMSDSAVVYAQHYWVGADNFKTLHHGLHVSTDRYWKIYSTLGADVDATTKFLYNGQASLSGGYLDNYFITNNEDSLVLLFRGSPAAEWSVYPYYTLNTWGSKTDKRGAFELSQLMSGEYTFGIYDASIPDAPVNVYLDCPDYGAIQNLQQGHLKVFPNPSNDQLNVQIDSGVHAAKIILTNMQGDTVLVQNINGTSAMLSVKKLTAGTYQLRVENARLETIAAQKVLIIH